MILRDRETDGGDGLTYKELSVRVVSSHGGRGAYHGPCVIHEFFTIYLHLHRIRVVGFGLTRLSVTSPN